MGEAWVPSRLGAGFRWLLASSWVSNLGDGFALAAGPLLVAAQTRNPTLVALATLLLRLPYLLFSVLAGVLIDRHDRVWMVAVVDALRGVVLAALAASILIGEVGIVLVLVAMFLLGTAEVFSNTASTTLLPSLVGHDDLLVANARLQTGFVTVYQLVGPPIGAVLFAAGMSAPFIGQSALVIAGAVLVAQINMPSRSPVSVALPRVGAEVAEGFRWVRSHPPVRTLVLTIFIFNITFGAPWGVLVLYAKQRLHTGAVGFGLLTTAAAVGGIVGTTAYRWLTARVSLGHIMRVGLIIETLTHLGLALTTIPAVALAIMVVFGAHAFVWNTTSTTVRQRAVPLPLQGRVTSINALGTYAGLIIGAALGGPLAAAWGISAPFWFGFLGSAAMLTLMWRQLTSISHHRSDQPTASQEPAP